MDIACICLPGVIKVKYMKNFLKGMAVGIATLVPGVSGGTMAVILGIYDELIHAIGSFFENWKKHSLLLVEIGFGSLMGVALFSRFMESTMARYPHLMQFLFMGIIIGGLPVLYRKSAAGTKRKKGDIIFFVLGFALVLSMSAKPAAVVTMATEQSFLSMLFLFIAGIVIAVALILPGISGSFVLLVLGLYEITLNAINNLNVLFLVPLVLGVVAGTLATTRIIESFLQKHPSKTYMLIMGFVAGSLISVFPGMPETSQIVGSVITLVAGFFMILWLSRRELMNR